MTNVQDVPAPERGTLEIHDRAAERLVVMAASEADGVAGPVSRVLGQKLGSADVDGRVKADVALSGDLAVVTVTLSVVWPHSVTSVAEDVRRRVIERLATLAGLRVSHVDVRVTALPTDRRAHRRVA